MTFFIENKKQFLNMGKKRSSVLASNNGEDLIESVYNSRKISTDTIFTKKQYGEALLKKVHITCKNERQKQFLKSIDEREITICVGESGVGKSYLSIAKALDLLKDSSNGYDKIFIITPIVESEDSIGYLKGDLEQKSFPYLYSVYYLFDKIIGEDARKKLVESKIIEPLYISYLRGINIDHAIVVSDESQNMTIRGIKTLLTRIGDHSKFIISGDLNQIDRFKKSEESGLKYVYDNLQNIPGIGFIQFEKGDIVRNPIISDILERFP